MQIDPQTQLPKHFNKRPRLAHLKYVKHRNFIKCVQRAHVCLVSMCVCGAYVCGMRVYMHAHMCVWCG